MIGTGQTPAAASGRDMPTHGVAMTIALGTLAYGTAAGMSFAIAAYFGAIQFRQQDEDPVFAPLALLGLLGALESIITLALHKSSSVDEYARYSKLFGLVGLLIIVTVVALVAGWTGGVTTRAWIAFTAGTAIIAGFQLALPTGLLVGQITALREVRLLGEPFVVHAADAHPWRRVLEVYLIATAALIATTLARGYRRADPRERRLIAGSVILLVMLGAYDSLVDVGAVDTTYVQPFAVVFFVITGSILIAGRMARSQTLLQHQAADLERTVVDRTATLNRTNDQLQRQLSRQRTTIRRVESLARQFGSLNQLALGPADEHEVRDSFQSLLDELGHLLRVDAVELHLSSAVATGRVPRSVTSPTTGPREPAERATQPSDAAVDGLEVAERIAIGSREVGRLVVRPGRADTYGSEERRFAALVVEQLAGFLHRLELGDQFRADAVHDERSRIARELHDSVTQRLYAVTFLADAVPRLQESQPGQVLGVVRRMKEIILSSLAELRVMLFELRPETLDAAHLPELIGGLAQMAPSPDKQVTVNVEPVPDLPQDVALGFYRLAQEAMSNAVRHSGSDTVVVALHQVDGATRLTVSDAGMGFDPTRERTGHGLNGLRERAALLGAELEIRSTPGVGTDLVVQWPAAAGAEPPAQPGSGQMSADTDRLAGRGPQ